MKPKPDGPGSHALVLGGTGMLRGLSLHLASQGGTVTAQGRDPARLQSLVRESRGSVHTFSCDWIDGTRLTQSLRNAIELQGPFALAVVWMHSPFFDSAITAARLVRSECPDCRYFDVQGSARRSDRLELREAQLRELFRDRYHRVRLGHMPTAGAKRWLTDEEIWTGVREAIDRQASDSVVGSIDDS